MFARAGVRTGGCTQGGACGRERERGAAGAKCCGGRGAGTRAQGKRSAAKLGSERVMDGKGLFGDDGVVLESYLDVEVGDCVVH